MLGNSVSIWSRRGRRQGFNPGSVSGVLRYGFVESASDAASYPDLTGNGHVIEQPNAAQRFTFSADGANGQPCFVCPGSDANEHMIIPGGLAGQLSGVDQPHTIVLVVRRNAGSRCLLNLFHDELAGSVEFRTVSALVRVGIVPDDGTGGFEETTNTSAAGWGVMIFRFDGTAYTVVRNMVADGPYGAPVSEQVTLNTGFLGLRKGGDLPWNGALAADAFYARAITDDECQYLTRGYAARYGITLAT